MEALKAGYYVAGFARHERIGRYLLKKGELPARAQRRQDSN
jgi:hypothetical protein